MSNKICACHVYVGGFCHTCGRLEPTPAEQEQARRDFEAAKSVAWERAARYTTDDRDFPNRNVIEICQGGNGDWYVSIAPEGEGTAGRGVRICTSGGAQQHAPGLANAIAAAFCAILEGDGQ